MLVCSDLCSDSARAVSSVEAKNEAKGGWTIPSASIPQKPLGFEVSIGEQTMHCQNVYFGCRSSAGKTFLCDVGHRGIQEDERPFGITELGGTVAPGHQFRFAHHLHVIFQPSELGFDVFNLELDDGGAIGCRLSTSLFE